MNGVGATYDALGRMVETNNGGTYTQYIYRPSGDKLGAFRAGALISAALPLPGGMGAVYNSNGLNYIRHMDYLGSSRLATTWAHTVYAKESYAPFGEPYNEGGPNQDRVFTGQTQDTTSGVYDYLFRKYDPTAGRWLSPDPAGWGAVDQTVPQSLNRYAYVVNNPMGAIDLSGLACVSIDLAGNVSVDNWGPDSMNAALCASDGGNYQDGFVDPYAIDNIYYSPTDRTASYSYGDGSWGGTMIESGQAVYQGVFLTEALFFWGTPPQASFSGPPPSISSGGSAPSRNSNISDQWPFNGNVIPGTHPQDGVCTTGPLADTMNSDPLVLACCQAHDSCYAQHQCNASSWVPINPGVCTACNIRAVACIKQAILP